MQASRPQTLLFSGSLSRAFAKEIADDLNLELSEAALSTFPDGEISVQIMENVRGRDTFVVQSIALQPNHALMELLIMIDALRRASARTIVAVIPYYGYCRQDRKDKPRVPITAKLVANLLVSAGATRVLTMDLHAGQLQGFFDIPVDNLLFRVRLAEEFRKLHTGEFVVVAPDVGSVRLAKSYASHLGLDFAVIDKHRVTPTEVAVTTVIGDVKGKDVLLADDMCSTGGTLVSAAKACREKGAKRVFAAVTHGILVGDAVKDLQASPIEALLMSNTIPHSDRLEGLTKLHQVSAAPLFAQAIRCIVSQESISSLFGHGWAED
jgi:ribose-phosphate pyrophosphokinase